MNDVTAGEDETGRTNRGTPLTEDLLDRLVEEAEQGFDEEQLTVRRGPGRPRLSEGEGTSDHA